MKLCSLSSGSSGNCIFVGTDHTNLLVDAGISGKRVEEGLHSIGFSGKEIDGILVTHEHSDHVKGLGVLARKLSVPIYTTRGTWEAIRRNNTCGRMDEDLFHEVQADCMLEIGDITVDPFAISHDAAQPVGYRFLSEGKSCAVATDMGTYTDYTIGHLQNLDAILMESNYDENMLEAGRYPYYLKLRIAGDHGHLSNESSGQLLCDVLHDNMKHIFLGHLSAENNYPQLAYETVCSEVTMGENPYKASDFPISVARRDAVGEYVEF